MRHVSVSKTTPDSCLTHSFAVGDVSLGMRMILMSELLLSRPRTRTRRNTSCRKKRSPLGNIQPRSQKHHRSNCNFLFLLLRLLSCLHIVSSVSISNIMGQAISSTQFFVYGKRHFTKPGYLRHLESYTEAVQSSPHIPLGAEGADGTDLTGKVMAVTGANSGLGKQVTTYLAAKHAKVYMLCRSPDRAEQAREDILKDTNTDPELLKIIIVDVGELDQVRKAVEEGLKSEPKVDCVVCNAGVLLNDKKVTSTGVEQTFASHLLGGTYLLSELLLPKLKAAEGRGRVVVVTSGGMYNSAIPSWDVLTNTGDNAKKYDGTMAYTYAKRGQVVMCEEWTKRHSDVDFVTVHPGWTDTPAVEEAFGDNKKYLEPLREPWQGAEGVAWLASTTQSLESGALYLDRLVQKKHMAGPFMTEGSFTKNSPEEIEEFVRNMEKAAGLQK